MARKRFTAEQIIMKLREAEVGLAQGQTVGDLPPGTSPLSKLDLGPFEVHSMV